MPPINELFFLQFSCRAVFGHVSSKGLDQLYPSKETVFVLFFCVSVLLGRISQNRLLNEDKKWIIGLDFRSSSKVELIVLGLKIECYIKPSIYSSHINDCHGQLIRVSPEIASCQNVIKDLSYSVRIYSHQKWQNTTQWQKAFMALYTIILRQKESIPMYCFMVRMTWLSYGNHSKHTWKACKWSDNIC